MTRRSIQFDYPTQIIANPYEYGVSSTTRIWESSSRPLYPKCVWVEGAGYRHFILDYDINTTIKRKYTNNNQHNNQQLLHNNQLEKFYSRKSISFDEEIQNDMDNLKLNPLNMTVAANDELLSLNSIALKNCRNDKQDISRSIIPPPSLNVSNRTKNSLPRCSTTTTTTRNNSNLIKKQLNGRSLTANDVNHRHNSLQEQEFLLSKDKEFYNYKDKSYYDLIRNTEDDEQNNIKLYEHNINLSKRQLTERVLQWLDLAGRNTSLVRPNIKVIPSTSPSHRPTLPMPTVITTKTNTVLCPEIPNKFKTLRRINTTESIMTNKPMLLRRSESVHHLSLTFGDDNTNENMINVNCNSPNQLINNLIQLNDDNVIYQKNPLKFGDFIVPTTYRCTRNFLSHKMTSAPPKCLPTRPKTSTSSTTTTTTTHQLTGGNNHNNNGNLHHSTLNCSETIVGQQSTGNKSNGKKLKKGNKLTNTVQSIENQYRSMIQRQILETTCNQQLAKRQLHIFMPNLPKKKYFPNSLDDDDCCNNNNSSSNYNGHDNCCTDSCLSTIFSSNLS